MKLSEYIAKNGDKEVSQEELNKLLGIKESKVWKPKQYQEFHYFGMRGELYSIRWSGNENDINLYNLGNCYKTEEEAIFARDKKLFEVKMERYLRENEDEEVDWNNNNQKKLCISFMHGETKFNIDSYYALHSQGQIYTTSEQALQQFFEDNEQDIKKYLFGVK